MVAVSAVEMKLTLQDTLQRKVNTSDASEYANVVGCCGSRFWGAFWLLMSCICESA